MRWWMLLFAVAIAGWSATTWAQDPHSVPPTMAACPRQPDMSPPTSSQRQQARDLAAQGQQASIVGNTTAARMLLRRAVELDPTDTNTAYVLARIDDAAREYHAALAAYCHFLALAPNAPEAEEVRRRVASLTRERMADLSGPRQYSLTAPNSRLSHARAALMEPLPDKDFLLFATVLPGYGQYNTNRPIFGAVVTTAALASLYYAFEPKSVSIDAIHREVTTYPHLVPGLLTAGAISALAATEAYIYASKHPRALPVALDITPSHVALWVPIALQGRLALGAIVTRPRLFYTVP